MKLSFSGASLGLTARAPAGVTGRPMINVNQSVEGTMTLSTMISADRSCGATQRHGTGADASVDRETGEMQGSFHRKRQADVDDYDSEEDLDYAEDTPAKKKLREAKDAELDADRTNNSAGMSWKRAKYTQDERMRALRYLDRCSGNKREAARVIGQTPGWERINRKTFQRWTKVGTKKRMGRPFNADFDKAIYESCERDESLLYTKSEATCTRTKHATHASGDP